MEETIEKDGMADITDENPTIISDGIFATPHKLTPTGKISYAKTRVYTQRYRKEWEQMPDFKGWLTSVPMQPTRAFCTYCKKNLHAHRLSLLKHTCTMKHQRAALLAHPENNKATQASEHEKACDLEDPDFEEVTVVSAIKSLANQDEDVDEFEYVVESLDIEEDEQNNPKDDHVLDEEADNSKLDSEEDEEPMNKKIKIEPFTKKDTLAQAMAHVHGEYLEHHDDDHGQVELEMIVESEDTMILPDKNEEVHSGNTEKNMKIKNAQKPTEMGNPVEKPQKVKAIAYKINSSNLAGVNLQGLGTVTLSSSPGKTLTLHNGKTLTLNTSKGSAGTQYVLSKVKGNLPALLMAGATKMGNQRTLVPKDKKPVIVPVPSTSADARENPKTEGKAEVQKGIEGLRNPCISTHVLDTSKGTPVTGLQVSLYKLMDGRWTFLNESTTSGSGRCNDLCNTSKTPITAGRYKMHFDVDKYFTLRRIETLYPFIEIVFDVKNPTGSYHIPVLLSPFGYTTYRGSDR